jgi:hypothetical protein
LIYEFNKIETKIIENNFSIEKVGLINQIHHGKDFRKFDEETISLKFNCFPRRKIKKIGGKLDRKKIYFKCHEGRCFSKITIMKIPQNLII